MELKYLPMKWYIAQIKWFEEELNKLPLCSFQKHRGNQVVRYFLDSDSRKYKQISPKSKNFAEAASIATKRADLKKKIDKSKSILRQHFKVDYESVKDNYIITPNTTSQLNEQYWNASLSEPNQHEIKTEYYSNGINYKSRYEMNFGNELTNYGLDFTYEPRVFINPFIKRYSDFGFYFPMFNKCTFIELLGRMKDKYYINDNVQKIEEYFNNSIYIGRDLFIISGDDNYMPGQETIRATIYTMIATLCELYVQKI